jgi:beta-fructofuranosidase
MESADGQTWGESYVSMQVPFHKFFRDPMVLKVAPNQWVLYTTAKGENGKSRVDTYQSFNLKEWQYIGCALDSGAGSERNSPFASTESPFVYQYEGHYYLSVTYNNDTPAFYGLLLPMKIWPNRASYNDTLLFTSVNPYDFGIYQGRTGKSSTFLTTLQTHGPEYIKTSDGRWFITTAGWPWVASLTKGEIAVAPLSFERLSPP